MPEETRHEIEAALADWRDLVAMAEQRMDALAQAMEQARWALSRLSGMAVSMAEVRWEKSEQIAADIRPAAIAEPPRVEPARPPPIYASEPGPWPSPRHDAAPNHKAVEPIAAPEPEPQAAAEAPAALDAEALREEVRLAVAAARAELEGSSGQREEPPMTADWGKMSGDWGPAVPASEPGETDAERQKVRRAVEEARAELFGAGAQRDESYETDVAEHKPAQDADTTEEPEDEREKVRKAVEAARAEMMGLGPRRDDLDEDGDAPINVPRPQWQPASRIDAGAPVMVIEDGEGHVELARVYEILNRLECASQATLMNYTTHSVSIGINSKENMPDAGKLGEAVKAVFGRPCTVTGEGSHLSVQLGHANGRVA